MKNLVLVLLITMVSCKNSKKETITAQAIINSSIKAAGGTLYETKNVAFGFRGLMYQLEPNEGKKVMRRTTVNDSLVIEDVVSQDFKRYINKTNVVVPDSMAIKYTNSINSVFYFALLPYGLNDAAVKKEYLGEVSIKGKEYYKVKVTFYEENGGEDFEDVYVYWFNKNTYLPDYLAYKFYTDGGGMRFRAAYNERYVSGVRFVDYENYTPKSNEVSVMQLDSLYHTNQLQLLSKIELNTINLY
ncbi:deoxyribose-phosphate aldolase [Cellulophaga sp. F20128]|uniref:DUF6503 family protein n=1 Tax=Cellulophaga sp. F20128 TaxID=2926413 RepID=UPI001FF3E283|nr:DUF6503 family protein [Cellulophaga sp. F20128]MCK0156591.1 deoxyribose-phosphate aldolase [Cellulophaga sp. F20128]